MKPKLLDLFCGAGGASMGYYRAGFEVEGVDINPQPHYPFKFYQADALESPLEGYDAYHASPPCQKWSKAAKQWRASGIYYLDAILPVRLSLRVTGKPFVIENVIGAPLLNPILLTAGDFGMRIKRDRYFEVEGFEVRFRLSIDSPRAVKMGRPVKDGDIIQPVGHFSGVPYARKQMGINWMTHFNCPRTIYR